MEWSSIKSKAGFSLIEALLAAAALALLVAALAGALIAGLESVATSGSRNRAVLLAEEGLEAARNIRNDAYANLINGSHGVAMSPNKWVFSGTTDTTEIFTRQVTVSAAGTDRKLVVSTVTWPQTATRTGTIVLTTYLTNWQPF